MWLAGEFLLKYIDWVWGLRAEDWIVGSLQVESEGWGPYEIRHFWYGEKLIVMGTYSTKGVEESRKDIPEAYLRMIGGGWS